MTDKEQRSEDDGFLGFDRPAAALRQTSRRRLERLTTSLFKLPPPVLRRDRTRHTSAAALWWWRDKMARQGGGIRGLMRCWRISS